MGHYVNLRKDMWDFLMFYWMEICLSRCILRSSEQNFRVIWASFISYCNLLTYCNTIWMSTFPSLLHHMKAIQQKAAVIIKKKLHFQHDLLTTGTSYTMSCETLILKFLHGELLRCFETFFQGFVQDKNLYTLRNRNYMQIPQPKTVRSDFNPSVVCPKAWNTLPSLGWNPWQSLVRYFKT